MKIYSTLILAGLLSVFSTTSQAAESIYAGFAVGSASYDYEDIDSASATKAFIGYNVNDKISIEATLFDSGEADITSLPGFTLSSDGFNVSVLYHLQSPNHNELSFLLGGGFYSFDTTLAAFGSSISESGSGLSLAAGINYALTENLAIRADIDMFVGVKDFADDSGMDSFNVGLVVSF